MPTLQQCNALKPQFYQLHPEYGYPSSTPVGGIASAATDAATAAFYDAYPDCRPSVALDDLQIFLQNRVSFHPEYVAPFSSGSSLTPTALGLTAFLSQYPQYSNDAQILQMKNAAEHGVTGAFNSLINPLAYLPRSGTTSTAGILIGGVALVGIALFLISRSRA